MADNKTATTQVDLTCVKPYGDALNDGKVADGIYASGSLW